MADNRMQIIIEGIDRASKVFNDLNAQVKTLRNEAQQSGRTLGESFSGAKPHLEGIHDQFGRIRTQIMGIVAAWKLLDIARDSVMLQSRVETLSAVLGVMGKNVNLTAAEMNAYVAQVKAMGITTEASQQTVIRLVQAQLDLSKSGQLARVAQDAAVIGNINSSEALERMVHGIVTLQPEILRTIGITVNFENEYKKAGATMGKNMEQLTQAEKQQIAMNAVLAEGIKIQGSYEAAMGTAGKQLKSMERYTEELKLKFGEIGGGAFTTVIFEIVNSLKEWDKSLSSMKDSGAIAQMSDDLQYGVLVAISDIKALAGDLWNILKEFGPAVKVFVQLIVMAVDGWGNIYAAMRPVSEILGRLIGMAWDFYRVLYNAAGIMVSIATKDFQGVKQYAKNLATAAGDMATKGIDAAGKAANLPGSIADSVSARDTAKQNARDRVAIARQDKAEEERDAALQRAHYGLRKPTYKPGEVPAKKGGGKGAENAMESWASKMRDLETDMQKALYPYDELARKLEDIKNKYDDLVAQAKKYAKEHKKTFDTAKVEEWRKVMEKAARDADAEKKLKAWADIERQITDRTAPELQKRLAAEDKFIKDSEEKLKKAGFTQEEIAEKMVQVTAAAADRKKKVELDYINTVMEAESRRYLSQLDMMEKERYGSKTDIARQRISVYESLLGTYQQRWESETDPMAKITWADKIDDVRSKLVDLNITLEEQEGIFTSGLGKGLRDYLWEMKSIFQQAVDIARETATSMQTAFSDLFFDIFQGKMGTLWDHVKAFLTSVQRALSNALGQQTSGFFTKALSSLFSSGGNIGTASGDVDAGYFDKKHAGGIVRKFIPTFHGGGLNDNERLVINKVGERYITEEQNSWLNRVARVAEGGQPNVVVNIDNKTGIPFNARELAPKTDKRQQIRTIMLELAGTDPAIRGAFGVKGA
ncbi:MAG TPA: hypothetical protein PLR60_06525 [Syntrophorhabdaceae bacterium]|nr:hypothetical protein [Syntrophorhabdaceae bacterium]